MGTYRTVSLLLVAGTLVFILGMRLGENRAATPAAAVAGDGSCCTLPVNPAAKTAPKLKIPTGSGLPCLVEFGSDECQECRRMIRVLAEITPVLKGRVDVIQVDTDLHPGEAQRHRLRMVPTQLLLDAAGTELWRNEGYLPTAELLAKVKSSAKGAS